MTQPDPTPVAGEPRRLSEHWMLDDIADRDAQTRPITNPAALPLGRDGTKYDHAREQVSDYHLDTPTLAMGDRHLLLREVRRLRAEAASPAALDVERLRRVFDNLHMRIIVAGESSTTLDAVPWDVIRGEYARLTEQEDRP